MTARAILFIALTIIVILFMKIHHDSVIMIHSQFVNYMKLKCYNNTSTTLLPLTYKKNLNDKTAGMNKLNKKDSDAKERNDMITHRQNRNNTITDNNNRNNTVTDTTNRNNTITVTKNRSSTITDRMIRNNTITQLNNRNGTTGSRLDIYRYNLQHNLKTSSTIPDVPKTLQMSTQSPISDKTIYFVFVGRLGNALFEFTSIYAIKRTTNSRYLRFKETKQIPKLIKLFPKMKKFLKTVPALPSRLLRLPERVGGQVDHTLAQRIMATKSDVLVFTYLGRYMHFKSSFCSYIGKFLNLAPSLLEYCLSPDFNLEK